VFVLSLIVSSCNEEFKNVTTKNSFPYLSKQKMWRHRVNSPEEQSKYSNCFPGLEFDVFYDDGQFYVAHDEDEAHTITLESYFDAVSEPDKYNYWLDLKNLNFWNQKNITKELKRILEKYGIRENLICESKNASQLAKLNESGIYTSYWIPHFDNYDQSLVDDAAECKSIRAEISENLKQCRHNAISAHYKMVPFVEKYFPLCNLHIWTNGLESEEDKATINEIAQKDFVKVILVDYEMPF